MTGVFANIKDEHVRAEPFPHVCIRGALDKTYYDDLADGYPRFHDQVLVSDEHVDVVDHVEYKANMFIFMVNSAHTLHGISPRQPTRHIRRYINFLAELRIPVFDLDPCQEAGAPWAVMGGKPQ